MGAGSGFEMARLADAAACRSWVARLEGDAARKLAQLVEALEALERSALAPDPAFEWVEQLRPALLAEAESELGVLRQAEVPLPRAAWVRGEAAFAALRRLSNTYRRLYTSMLSEGSVVTRSVIPGAADSLRVVMPLVRALDAESRMVAGALRGRLQVPDAAWDDLCTLAQHMRASTFLDEPFLDPVALVKPTTARGLFVYPALLLLAQPQRRAVLEMRLVDRLARRWAGRVGFRIDGDGRIKDSANGPVVVLSGANALRLDAQRLAASLARKREQLLGAEGARPQSLPAGIGLEQAVRLLDELRECWTVAQRPAPRGVPPVPQARLVFGLGRPAQSRDPGVLAGPTQSENAMPGAGRGGYLYSQWEPDTIMRIARDRAPTEPEADRPSAPGESANWLSLDGRPDGAGGAEASHATFERFVTQPPALLGALVAIEWNFRVREGEQVVSRDAVRLGVVDSRLQTRTDPTGLAQAHRIGVQLLPGTPRAVEVRLGTTMLWEPGWLLEGDGGVTRLVMARGAFRAPGECLLRDRRTSTRWWMAALVRRDRDFDLITLQRSP